MSDDAGNNASGLRWARVGLTFGAAMSIIGNVAHTVLLKSDVSLWLRIPFSVIWPLALFIGIEIFVRVRWRRSPIDIMGQFLLIVPVSSVAAVVSYQHLHALMKLANEDGFSAMIGPLAIDGLMLGSTIAMLAIRASSLAAEIPVPVKSEDIEDLTEIALSDWDSAIDELVPPSPELVEATTRPAAVRVSRGTVNPDHERAVSMLLNDATRDEIITETRISPATYGRFAKVYKILRSDPDAILDPAKEKVRPELIDIIRAATQKEAVS